jgi:hypothetical protein
MGWEGNMRRVSLATQRELVAAVAARYARSSRSERSRILDELVAVTGHVDGCLNPRKSGRYGQRTPCRSGVTAL